MNTVRRDVVEMRWQCRDRVLTLSRPVVAGILNMTPDSFSDGGRCGSVDHAVALSAEMLAAGAVIVDVGGESTRPGFIPVEAEEEKRRTIPVMRALRAAFPTVFLSIDTMKADVAAAAVDAGADIINDVSGLADPCMVDVVRASGVGLVLMHGYAYHVGERREVEPGALGGWVADGLRRLLDEVVEQGIPLEQTVIDPGFGFGKRHAENREVLHALPSIAAVCGRPLFIGGSRKHFVNGLHPEAGGDTVAASVAFANAACLLGGKVFRVHDVLETCRALCVALQ